jgi:serine/threonine-protein kinase
MTSDRDGAPPLGRYALHDVIGSGAMASVHLGRVRGDAGFGATVAIKRLRPELTRDPDFVARFLDEARLSASISHPNVVKTLDAVSAQGELFVIMEYVHGESLGRLAELSRELGEPVPPLLATTLLADVLGGLHAAHEASSADGEPLEIVHRDVSPQNILVGVDGTARVLDFGVATAAVRLAATRDGSIRGKLAYMAPEQLRGRATRQSDVYACGVVLWELLTEERLFSGERDTDVIEAALLREIEPPSRTRQSQGLTAPLDDVVMRALARKPSERFATAREMALALERVAPRVPAEEVSAWVMRLASRSLTERAAIVERIEASSTPRAKANGETPPSMKPRPARTLPSTRRLAVVTALGVSALLAYAIGRSSKSDTPVVAIAASSVEEAPGAIASTSPPEAPRRPTLAAPPAAPHLARPVRPSPWGRFRAHAPSTPPASRLSPCDPPFSLDDAGRKLYKESCLR